MVCASRSTRTPARSVDTARPVTLGSPSRADRSAASTPASERGLDQFGVAGGEHAVDPQATLERAGDVQTADLVGLACPRLASVRAFGVGGRCEPVASSEPEALRVQHLGLLQPKRLMVSGEVGVAADAVSDGAEVLHRESPRPSLGTDGGQPCQHGALPPTTAQTGPGRTGPLCRPRGGGQRTVGRPSAVPLEPLQEQSGQGVDSIQQLLGSQNDRWQVLFRDVVYFERYDLLQCRFDRSDTGIDDPVFRLPPCTHVSRLATLNLARTTSSNNFRLLNERVLGRGTVRSIWCALPPRSSTAAAVSHSSASAQSCSRDAVSSGLVPSRPITSRSWRNITVGWKLAVLRPAWRMAVSQRGPAPLRRRQAEEGRGQEDVGQGSFAAATGIGQRGFDQAPGPARVPGARDGDRTEHPEDRVGKPGEVIRVVE